MSILDDSRTARVVYGPVYASDQSYIHQGDIYNFIQGHRVDEVGQCLRGFKVSDYESAKDDVPSHASQTCKWVLDHPSYEHWRKEDGSHTLWISASPGCGKSVLSKMLVDGGLIPLRPTSVCYFFFKAGVPEQESLASALCAILHQLFTLQPFLLYHAVIEYKLAGPRICQEIPVLRRIFTNVVSDPRTLPAIFILDALDECRQQDRQYFFEWIRACSTQKHNEEIRSIVKFMITSRPHDDIRRNFKRLVDSVDLTWLQGEMEDEQLRHEIDSVIRHEIESWNTDLVLPFRYREDLYSAISQLEQRTYLWWNLVRESVRTHLELTSQHDHSSIKYIVSQLPKSLEDTFEHLLQNVSAHNRQISRAILEMMIAARRPLHVAEGAQLLREWLHKGVNGRHRIFSMSEYQLTKSISSLCGSLVRISQTRLIFIHATVREFLMCSASTTRNPSPLDDAVWQRSMSLPQAHCKLAFACNHVIQAGRWKAGCLSLSRTPKTPDYASRFVWDHLSEVVRRLPQYQSLFRITHVIGFGMDLRVLDADKMSLLHHLILFSGPSINYLLVEAVLQHGGLVQSADNGNMHCLQYAARQNDAYLVALLLKYGFQVNHLVMEKKSGDCMSCLATQKHTGSSGLTALHAAILFGSTQTTSLLIERGADLSIADQKGRNPLHMAVSLSSPGKRGCSDAWRDGEYMLDYCWEYENEAYYEKVRKIARRARLSIVQMLCKQHPGLVHSRDSRGRTPLHLVRYNDPYFNATTTVELLLSYGADPVAKDSRGITPIHTAAKCGDSRCLDLLVPEGKESAFSVPDDEGRTVLHYAALSRDERNVLYVLARSNTAHLVHTVDNHDQDPLQVALFDHGSRKNLGIVYNAIIPTLLSKTARADRVNCRGHDALAHYLVNWRCWTDAKIVKVLINHGADVLYCDTDGISLAHHLARSEHDFDIECLLLLEHAGAAVTTVDKQGRNVLHHAAICGNVNGSMLQHICGCLRLDLNANDHSSKSPLEHAIEQRSIKRHPHLYRSSRWQQAETLLLGTVAAERCQWCSKLECDEKNDGRKFLC